MNILTSPVLTSPNPTLIQAINWKSNSLINVNIKMYIFDHLRMYIFAILPLDRYIFSIDRIFP